MEHTCTKSYINMSSVWYIHKVKYNKVYLYNMHAIHITIMSTMTHNIRTSGLNTIVTSSTYKQDELAMYVF